MGRSNNLNIQFDETKDFGTLCICAIRYCQGRRTYMPSYVIEIVSQHLDKISDKDIRVMLDDCEFQERMNLYGDEIIDKPLWLNWKETLEAEMYKRQSSKKFSNMSKEEMIIQGIV